MTDRDVKAAAERIQSNKWLVHGPNQIQIRNVQRRMFPRLLVLCREGPGRVQKLVIKRTAGRELLSNGWRPRAATGTLLALLFLFTLAYRIGAPTRLLDWPGPSSLDRVWSITEQAAIRLQNRARADYQTVWLAYCFTRQLINLEEQPARDRQPAKRSWEQCRLTEPSVTIQCRTPEPATTNRLRDCVRWQGAVRE